MSQVRKRIPRARLLESQTTTATLTTFNGADMTAIQELRAKYNEKFEETRTKSSASCRCS
ncbi:MAG: 2-oxo acid dehydrogenase subunit E2 [Gemmataceae bacterium]